jgi:hypothetical protein
MDEYYQSKMNWCLVPVLNGGSENKDEKHEIKRKNEYGRSWFMTVWRSFLCVSLSQTTSFLSEASNYH